MFLTSYKHHFCGIVAITTPSDILLYLSQVCNIYNNIYCRHHGNLLINATKRRDACWSVHRRNRRFECTCRLEDQSTISSRYNYGEVQFAQLCKISKIKHNFNKNIAARDVMISYCRVAEDRCVAKQVPRYWEWAPRVYTGLYRINIRQQSMVGSHRIIAMMIIIIILHSGFFFMFK